MTICDVCKDRAISQLNIKTYAEPLPGLKPLEYQGRYDTQIDLCEVCLKNYSIIALIDGLKLQRNVK
jgi:hypothetical protein